MSIEDLSLIQGGDCFSHWHSEDRVPTQSFLHGLNGQKKTVSISTDLAIPKDVDIILANTATSDLTVTLPYATNGIEVTVIKSSASHTLTVEPSNSATIEGFNSVTFNTAWTARTFKALGGNWIIVSGYMWDNPPHGSFTSTQSQTMTAINTPKLVSLNVTNSARLMTRMVGDGIHVEQSGTYNVQFSLQFTNTDSQAKDAAVWIRKNGIDVPYSSGVVTIQGTHGGQPGYVLVAGTFSIHLEVGGYIELWWSANSTSVVLETLPPITTPFVNPGAPSVSLTMTYISSES